MTAIRKFNSYCERLEYLYNPTWEIPLPAPLPTKLTELHSDSRLMEDVWITPSIGEVPQWLEDSHVRDGICALLKRDRCEEEQIWLSIEADNLCRFFGDELAALELALCLPERGLISSFWYHLLLTSNLILGELFAVPLQQRHDNFLRLQIWWSNSLATSVHFASQVNKSLDIAATLSGAPLNASHHTINASTLAVPDYEGKDELSIDPDHSPAINSEQAAVADVLEGQMSALELEDDDSTAYGHKTNAIICWNLLVDDFSPPLCIPPHEWGNLIPGKIIAWIRPSSNDGIPSQIFDPRDISFLSSPTARLNDVCINSCAILLWHSQLDASGVQCAMLSTHDLPRIRYNALDDVIWRNTSWIHYWEKDIWVLPIHRPLGIRHWVLCIIRLSDKNLFLFDSLGDRQPWENDVKVSLIPSISFQLIELCRI